MKLKPTIISATEFLGRLREMKGILSRIPPLVVTGKVELDCKGLKLKELSLGNITFKEDVTIENLIRTKGFFPFWIRQSNFLGSFDVWNCRCAMLRFDDCRTNDITFFRDSQFETISLENTTVNGCLSLSSLRASTALKIRGSQCEEIEITSPDLGEFKPFKTSHVWTDDPTIARQFELFRIPVALTTKGVRDMMRRKKHVGLAH